MSNQFGLSPRIFLRSLRGLPVYLRELREFRKSYNGQLNLKPCLQDRYEEGGATQSEYFWQDLLVARWIFAAKPIRHIDIGSRVDGFVAHVASFRDIEVCDVRPIQAQVPGVLFKQMDLMRSDTISSLDNGGYDSLSCLHALEHFGLGRYGDPINPRGHELGIANMASLLQADGTLYLSIPIGQERVEFNANRVFNPVNMVRLAEQHGLSCKKLVIIAAQGVVEEVLLTEEKMQMLADTAYNLGIFIFTKKPTGVVI